MILYVTYYKNGSEPWLEYSNMDDNKIFNFRWSTPYNIYMGTHVFLFFFFIILTLFTPK